MKQFITTDEKLRQLVHALSKNAWNIISAGKEGTNFIYINDGKDLVINADSKPTKLSAKEFFFPKTEPLFFYKKNHDGVDLLDPKDVLRKTVLFGVKPCDAAAVPVMGKVFNWDYKDEFFNRRVEQTVIIGMACSYSDVYCFCTSTGLSPESSKGSDVFLKPAQNSSYIAEAVTPKGEAFVVEFSSFFDAANENDVKLLLNSPKGPEKKFDANQVKQWLDGHFEDPLWNEVGETCLGCAQCAFTCPTCHCFDIVDESCGYNCGRRVKNWDGCQFGLFTKHASGHNPRGHQPERYRQRISHKFKYYQDKFGEILCTGCGRCTRGCPVGIDIAEIAQEINKRNSVLV
ncbi:MAG: 4Fe-4S dicluster domain-containing protein [Ignavibacteriales bacterium]|nr:4Fe-4S dicluster domain-containing protein [Ignavibacteriales bacterium]